MVKYYKKYSPEMPVPVPSLGNFHVKFESLDGLVGYVAVGKPEIIAEFEKAMAENRCGISEIPREEYAADYEEPKKNGKSPTSSRFWRREEFGKTLSSSERNPLTMLGAEAVQRVIAVTNEQSKPLPVPEPPKPCTASAPCGMRLETTPPANAPDAKPPTPPPVAPADQKPYQPRVAKRLQKQGTRLKSLSEL